MKLTLEFVLFCQSPALFLLALLLCICYFGRRKKRKALAALDLLGTIACLLLGVALYYFGMLRELFTIHDFWQIRTVGWIGLCVTAVIAAVVFLRRGGRLVRRHQDARAAVKAKNAAAQELEKAKAEAFEAGKAAAGEAAAGEAAAGEAAAGQAAAGQAAAGQAAAGQAAAGQAAAVSDAGSQATAASGENAPLAVSLETPSGAASGAQKN